MNIAEELIKDSIVCKENFKTDSRKAGPGDVFIAIKGACHDGHDHIAEVLDNGVSRVICEYKPSGVSAAMESKILCVDDSREVLGELAKFFYGDPSSKMKVYGVTGTNGKTTTVFLIDKILKAAGIDSGFVSTVFINTNKFDVRKAVMTTPDVMALNSAMSEMMGNGKGAAVVEISSHALNQKRTWGIELDSAIFTNITPEHLDYHVTMDAYLEDKVKIFNSLKPGGVAVINADDSRVMQYGSSVGFPRLVTFGIRNDADIMARDVKVSIEGTEFVLDAKGFGAARINVGLIGLHNVSNILGAAGALLHNGVALDDIARGLADFYGVPGRLEMVPSEENFTVFVDYAHTPNALENMLGSVKSLVKGELVCVFGCGGDRDRGKRPVMGKIAADMCDKVIITSDNPRSEEPEAIIGEIKKGMSEYNNYSIIINREDAIKAAIEGASDDDVIVLAGKGHEDYQIVGDKKLHFDDREIAAKYL